MSPLDPLTSACARTLSGWDPPDAEQAALRRDFLAHLKRHPTGWSRACAPAHLTASALIWASARDEVLLVHHRLIGRWLQTGGHLEADDPSLEAAAEREATEETGLTDLELDPVPLRLTTHEVPCGRDRSPSLHLDVQYLTRSSGGGTPRFGYESTDVRWFPAKALPNTDASVRALVSAAATRRGS